MSIEEKSTVRVSLRMKPYQRDLIDNRARIAGMTRTEYMIQSAAYSKKSFVINAGETANEGKRERKYNVYRDGGDALGYLAADKGGSKPRKAADNLPRTDGNRIYIRASEYEKDAIRKLASDAGMSMTDFILWCTVYRPAATGDALAKEELVKLWRELRAQGRNLNQIAAAANRLAAIAWRDDVDASLLDQLCRELIEDETRTRPAINEAIQAVTARMDRSRLERRKDQGQGGEREDDDA